MTGFLIVAALLLIIAIVALVMPLLKSNVVHGSNDSAALSLHVLKEQLSDLEHERNDGSLDSALYDTERAEIERRAIEDARQASVPSTPDAKRIGLSIAVGIGVCALAISLYYALGTPAAFDAAAPGQQQNAHAVTPQQIQAMVARLSERLQDNPADGEGWLMLARSYSALGRFPEASAAFGRAVSQLPEDAQLLADYADTLAMAQGRSLRGEPEKIIQRARKADPRNIKVLALSGSVAFERQDYAVAIAEWRKILDLVPPDSGVVDRVQTSIADAESRMGGTTTTGNGGTAAVGVSIRGMVSLDSNLRGQASDGDSVFVFARAASGPRIPLAIARFTVRDLPTRFTLDDRMGMPGGPKLSDHQQVIVGARISKSGDATAHPGDLEGYSEVARLGGENVRVSISKVVK